MAQSELYRAPVSEIRRMAFRDFVVALLFVDYQDAVRSELDPDDDEDL